MSKFYIETGKKRTNFKSVLILGLAAVFLVSTSAYAFGLLTSQNTMNSTGIVANSDIGVYSNAACTQARSSIDWGTCYPGDNKTSVVYLKNLGTVNSILTIQASNWAPSLASSYLTLVSTYAGQALTPGQVLQVTFTLRVSKTIQQISSFAFNINIISQG